jgi:hypothetical protein
VGIVDGVALDDGSRVGQTAADDRGPQSIAGAASARKTAAPDPTQRRSSDDDAE